MNERQVLDRIIDDSLTDVYCFSHSVGPDAVDQVDWGFALDARILIWADLCFLVLAKIEKTRVRKMNSKISSEDVRAQVWQAGYGHHDAFWLGFYEYFYEVCGIKTETDLRPLIELSKLIGWFWPFTDTVIITEKPSKIHMKDGVLHKDGGMALRYSDGFGLYRLNGVTVTKEIAETPGEKLPVALVLKARNVEVRRELVRKIGMARIAKELDAEVIDSEFGYDLILLDLQDGRKRPYLRMKNPSIDAAHVEGVPPNIKSVQAALAWRNGTKKYVAPQVLT